MVAERDFILSEQGAEEPLLENYIPDKACQEGEGAFSDDEVEEDIKILADEFKRFEMSVKKDERPGLKLPGI